jgi:hypothetical protein
MDTGIPRIRIGLSSRYSIQVRFKAKIVPEPILSDRKGLEPKWNHTNANPVELLDLGMSLESGTGKLKQNT